MNIEMCTDQSVVSTPWGFSTLGEIRKLSPISKNAVVDWYNSPASFESFKWGKTPGLEDHFVGVLSNVKVYSAKAWLPKKVHQAFNWQVNYSTDIAVTSALVIAISEDLLIERIKQTSAFQADDLLDAWIDYVLNVALYKPGLRLSNPQEILVKRGRSKDMMLADFEAPAFLPEDELTSQLHMLKISRAKHFGKQRFCIDIFGDPKVKISLAPTGFQPTTIDS